MGVAIETKNKVIEITLGKNVEDSLIPIAIDVARTLYDKGFDCIDKCNIRDVWMSSTRKVVRIALYIRQNMYEIFVTMPEDLSKLIEVSIYPDTYTIESTHQANALEFLIRHKLVDKKFFFNLDFVEFI